MRILKVQYEATKYYHSSIISSVNFRLIYCQTKIIEMLKPKSIFFFSCKSWWQVVSCHAPKKMWRHWPASSSISRRRGQRTTSQTTPSPTSHCSIRNSWTLTSICPRPLTPRRISEGARSLSAITGPSGSRRVAVRGGQCVS